MFKTAVRSLSTYIGKRGGEQKESRNVERIEQFSYLEGGLAWKVCVSYGAAAMRVLALRAGTGTGWGRRMLRGSFSGF
jgi:hypothetical protein